MTITVCIPTIRTATIGFAVASVVRQTWADWELLVLGQGPDAQALRATVERAADGDPRVTYVHLDVMGLSAARNAAIARATGEIIAFTDDDCEAAADWLEVLHGIFAEDPEVGLVGGAVLAPDGAPTGPLTTCPVNEPAEVRYVPGPSRGHPQGWDWIGANFAVRRDVALRVGPFDPALGAGTTFPSGEDTDWKLRLEALGVVMLSTPRSVVHHTYGARHGIRAGLAHSRNYARGNAATAAKLTLMGDPFGEVWKSQALRGAADWRRDILPHRLPIGLRRRWNFLRTYREVRSTYRVGPDQMLQPTGPGMARESRLDRAGTS